MVASILDELCTLFASGGFFVPDDECRDRGLDTKKQNSRLYLLFNAA